MYLAFVSFFCMFKSFVIPLSFPLLFPFFLLLSLFLRHPDVAWWCGAFFTCCNIFHNMFVFGQVKGFIIATATSFYFLFIWATRLCLLSQSSNYGDNTRTARIAL